MNKEINREAVQGAFTSFPPFDRDETEIIAAMMKERGSSPYIYIGIANDLLAAGCAEKALEVLSFAGSFVGVYFPEGTVADNNYRESVELLRYIITTYPDEFKQIMKWQESECQI